MMVVLLGGCATDWTKQGGSIQALEVDRTTCTAQATAAYPVKIVGGGQKMSAPKTECEGSGPARTCRTMPATYLGEYSMDVNEKQRGEAVNKCLRDNGWTKG